MSVKDCSTPLRTDDCNASEETAENPLLTATKEKYMGTFLIPISCLTVAGGDHAIRAIDRSHVNEMKTNFEISMSNRHNCQFPIAVGVIPEPCSREDLGEGKVQIEIIDGNHTLVVQKELAEVYQQERCLKERSVAVYHGLTSSQVKTLALLRNEESALSKKTTDFEKVSLMRRELFSIFKGQFSPTYLEHIYRMFNCICPNNKKEQSRRKKNMFLAAKLATMEDKCWDLVSELQRIKPDHSMYIYGSLAQVPVNEGRIILQKAVDKEIKFSCLARAFRDLPKATVEEETILQRIRLTKSATSGKGTKSSQDKDRASNKVVIKDEVTANERMVIANERMVIPADDNRDKENIKGLVQEAKRLKQELCETHEKIKEREMEHKVMLEEMADLKKELNDTNNKMNKMETEHMAELAKANEKVSTLEKICDYQRQKLNDHRDRLKLARGYEIQIKSLKEKLEELEEENTRLREQMRTGLSNSEQYLTEVGSLPFSVVSQPRKDQDKKRTSEEDIFNEEGKKRVKYSCASLHTYLRSASKDMEQLTSCATILTQIFNDYLKVDRVSVPMLKMLDQLLSKGCFEILTQDESCIHKFPPKVLELVKQEIHKSGDPHKLMASADVFCGLLQFRGEVRKKSLVNLSIFLCHKFSRVRKTTANKLYEALMIYDDVAPDENLDEIITILSETNWDEKLTTLRLIRNNLCDLLQIPKPVLRNASKQDD